MTVLSVDAFVRHWELTKSAVVVRYVILKAILYEEEKKNQEVLFSAG